MFDWYSGSLATGYKKHRTKKKKVPKSHRSKKTGYVYHYPKSDYNF